MLNALARIGPYARRAIENKENLDASTANKKGPSDGDEVTLATSTWGTGASKRIAIEWTDTGAANVTLTVTMESRVDDGSDSDDDDDVDVVDDVKGAVRVDGDDDDDDGKSRDDALPIYCTADAAAGADEPASVSDGDHAVAAGAYEPEDVGADKVRDDEATSDAAVSVDAFAPSTRRKRQRSGAAAAASKEAERAEKAARSARCVHCRGTSRWAAEPTRCSRCSTERHVKCGMAKIGEEWFCRGCALVQTVRRG